MEFWLMQGADKLHLPVPPPSYSIKKSLNNSTVIVEGIGEVSFIGKPKLMEIPTIESFFPAHAYSFCQYKDFPTPSECIGLIDKFVFSGKPIRYLATGKINLDCTIESFEHGMRDGTGDVYFSLELKEYKVIAQPVTIIAATAITAAVVAAAVARPVTKVTPASYTVKSGDTLSAIAKRQYGDGSKYMEIAAKNGLANPNSIQVGQVLLL